MHLTGALVDFVEASASRQPTPGGGAVAPLVGALGAALAEMACAFTVLDARGKPRDAGGGAEVMRGFARLRRVREALLPLLESDCEAYAKVDAALKMPRRSEEEKRRRSDCLHRALKGALEVPLQCARLGVEGLEALDLIAGSLNRSLATDTASAALFFGACFRGSWYNVRVNLKALEDGALSARVAAEGRELAVRAAGLEQRILAEADRALEG